MKFSRLLITLAATACIATSAYASKMGIVTGTKTGTYYAVGKDISSIASSEKLPMTLRESNGSIDNLQKMVKSGENAALGIVQADVLAFLQKSDKPTSKDISKKLRAIMPLFKEEIHILARKDIKSVEDLNDKRVVVGNSGSGSMMTSINLFGLLDVKPKKMFQTDAPEAVVAVLADRADAMVFVGGKPVPMFKNLEQLSNTKEKDMHTLLENVHFLALPAASTGEHYETATISPDDYSFINEIVPTLAVRSVLVTYDFTLKDTPYYKMRCKQLGKLAKALRNKLPELQKTGHRKWQEVSLDTDISMWKRDACAWPSINPANIEKAPAPIKKEAKVEQPKQTALEKELLQIIGGE